VSLAKALDKIGAEQGKTWITLGASLFIDLLVVLLACHTASPPSLAKGGRLMKADNYPSGVFFLSLIKGKRRGAPNCDRRENGATTLSNHEDAQATDGRIHQAPTRLFV
jgi:hypothetical protein